MKKMFLFSISLMFLLSVSAQEPEPETTIHDNVGTWVGDNDSRISESEIVALSRDFDGKTLEPYTWFEDPQSYNCDSKPGCRESINNETVKREAQR
jgi:hypothetical protein